MVPAFEFIGDGFSAGADGVSVGFEGGVAISLASASRESASV